MKIKNFIDVIIGVVGSIVVSFLGGWDNGIATLFMFMVIDFITGLYIGAILKRSPKSEHGGLTSKASFNGLVKKAMIIIIVGMMYQLDILFGIDYLRNGTILAYCFSEGISIIENAGIIGVPIPDIVKKGIDLLNNKVGDNNEN